MKEYDLVVIGSGVGLTVLNEGLVQGLHCALIEDSKIGGTCLTRGCIPSKILGYPADLIRAAELGKNVGVYLKLEKLDWKTISARMWDQIEESTEMEKNLQNVHNLDLYQGTAEFVDRYQMRVKLNNEDKYSATFRGKKFVIATGARSWIPPIEGIQNVKYITSESFFGPDFPKDKPWTSLILIGGGVIAAEFAHFFAAFGTKVTIIEMLPRILSTEEPEISAVVDRSFRTRMTVLTSTNVLRVRQEGNEKIIAAENVNTHKLVELRAEALFICTGRQSNADLLHLQKCGIETDKKGWIKTNAYLETSVPNIWCIGDANGFFQFRHKANHDAEICANNLLATPEDRMMVDYSVVPWAIFTEPQVGHVGLTEEEALKSGQKVFVAIKKYSSVAKGYAMGIEPDSIGDGFVKLIVNERYRIIGAHVVGPEAALLVQQFVYLMNAGFTCGEPNPEYPDAFTKFERACPEGGSFMPIYHSMIIHPSLNEVAGWVIGNLRPVDKSTEHDHHPAGPGTHETKEKRFYDH